jgi:hypothetical protein
LLIRRFQQAIIASLAASASLVAQQSAPGVRILLPERTRLLEGQQVDLVLEVRNSKTVTNLSVIAGGVDLTSAFSAPVATSLDCNSAPAVVLRANLQSFAAGTVNLNVSLSADGATVTDSRSILVRPFTISQQRNVILFIGDAMGTAYRDAARLVSRSIVDGKARTHSGMASSTTSSRWTKCRLAVWS